ncbi:glucoside xylosyltransferase 2-like [Daphnia pulicaria]|uniref:glucoside xylosyltransferase 2-like n=1 Tax=Daphnia pulicaria TaxID=35523 RepID=UPI001EEA5ED1|nr:glucoside xylosyltransferase 2-like [Daphnia pulicaria]
MARKTMFFIRAVIFISLILVLWNFFWVFRLQQPQQIPTKIESTPLSSVPQFMRDVGLDVPKQHPHGNVPIEKPQEIHIAAVVCGNRTNETIVMIKSALIRSSIFIKFILFADDAATSSLNGTVKLWPDKVLNRMSLDLRPITFPADKAEEWKKLFKPCASQRLFLPSLLQDVDSVLYMDTDTIFFTSPLNVWEHFNKMDDVQMAAVAPEHEDFSTGWYNRFARHPYYGNLGVNSGVMLMNLTRMRHFGWEKYVVPIYHEYKSKIVWGDQDIINIVFHFHPEKLYVYPCHYNYRPDHCMYMSVCKTAEEQGIHVLHGNRGSFHNKKQPAFKAVYATIEQYSFGEDLQTLFTNMKESLTETVDTNCGKLMTSLPKLLKI